MRSVWIVDVCVCGCFGLNSFMFLPQPLLVRRMLCTKCMNISKTCSKAQFMCACGCVYAIFAHRPISMAACFGCQQAKIVFASVMFPFSWHIIRVCTMYLFCQAALFRLMQDNILYSSSEMQIRRQPVAIVLSGFRYIRLNIVFFYCCHRLKVMCNMHKRVVEIAASGPCGLLKNMQIAANRRRCCSANILHITNHGYVLCVQQICIQAYAKSVYFVKRILRLFRS